MDNRVTELADKIVNYSCGVLPGDKVLISYDGVTADEFVKEIIRAVYRVGAYPYVEIINYGIIREIMVGCKKEQITFMNDYLLHQIKGMDAFINLSAMENFSELSDVPMEKLNIYNNALKEYTEYTLNGLKWSWTRYPNPGLAQLANMSTEGFKDFYFQVCNMDYGKLSQAMDPLAELMRTTDKVRITGPGTDISFSIKGIGSKKCDGHANIPDGEVYTAPVRDSVNGVISYNTPSEKDGFKYDNIVFYVEKGKIVEARANNTEKINELLNRDEGSRYFGEFALGVNPYIMKPMGVTLFDEKINGSFHLTPGSAYSTTDNGNRSSIHWDLVMIQRSDYGGGEIYFDDRLIRKDGLFVLEELQKLNPII